MRYRRDLLVGQAQANATKDDVMYVQQEAEVDQDVAAPEPSSRGGLGSSFKEMLARTAKSYGVTLTE